MKYALILLFTTQVAAAAPGVFIRVPLSKIFTGSGTRAMSFSKGRQRVFFDDILKEAMGKGGVKNIIGTNRASVSWQLPHTVDSHRILQFVRKITGNPDPVYHLDGNVLHWEMQISKMGVSTYWKSYIRNQEISRRFQTHEMIFDGRGAHLRKIGQADISPALAVGEIFNLEDGAALRLIDEHIFEFLVPSDAPAGATPLAARYYEQAAWFAHSWLHDELADSYEIELLDPLAYTLEELIDRTIEELQEQAIEPVRFIRHLIAPNWLDSTAYAQTINWKYPPERDEYGPYIFYHNDPELTAEEILNASELIIEDLGSDADIDEGIVEIIIDDASDDMFISIRDDINEGFDMYFEGVGRDFEQLHLNVTDSFALLFDVVDQSFEQFWNDIYPDSRRQAILAFTANWNDTSHVIIEIDGELQVDYNAVVDCETWRMAGAFERFGLTEPLLIHPEDGMDSQYANLLEVDKPCDCDDSCPEPPTKPDVVTWTDASGSRYERREVGGVTIQQAFAPEPVYSVAHTVYGGSDTAHTALGNNEIIPASAVSFSPDPPPFGPRASLVVSTPVQASVKQSNPGGDIIDYVKSGAIGGPVYSQVQPSVLDPDVDLRPSVNGARPVVGGKGAFNQRGVKMQKDDEHSYDHVPFEKVESGVYMSKAKYEKLLYRDEGVCKWKLIKEPSNYLMDCKMSPQDQRYAPFFKYCPYCGKKIEVE